MLGNMKSLFKKATIRFVFSILEKELLQKINFEPARLFVQKLHDDYAKIKEILLDNDPNDQEQLKWFWQENQDELVGDTIEGVIAAVQHLIVNKDDAQQVIDLLNVKLLEQKEEGE